MALVKCYEFGAEISSLATHCPKCGAPQKKSKKILTKSPAKPPAE